MKLVMCVECKRATHFNIEAKLALMIGGDTYQHQVTITKSTLCRYHY